MFITMAVDVYNYLGLAISQQNKSCLTKSIRYATNQRMVSTKGVTMASNRVSEAWKAILRYNGLSWQGSEHLAYRRIYLPWEWRGTSEWIPQSDGSL